MVKPIIFYEGEYAIRDLTKFKKEHKVWKTIDIYDRQIKELSEVRFTYVRKKNGNWIFFPWSGEFIHAVNEDEYLELRTNRNRNLITTAEQKKLYSSCIGVLGLSVGSSLAIGLQYQGIANNIKLAEFDTLETTNLNRVPAGLQQIGMRKADVALQKIYEINPYATPILYEKGLTKKDLQDFVHGKPKPDVIFEIIDDFEMKVLVRIEARKAKIPVVTFANLGDTILSDIDRYDLKPGMPLFNGLLGNFPEEILNNPDEDKNKYAVKMVGVENVPPRAMESVKEIGKTLVGRPQLSSTVAINSALGVFVTRKIILGDKKLSGRKLIRFKDLF